MFYDYKLRPDAKGNVMVDTIIRHSAYVLAPLFVMLWFILLEPDTFSTNSKFIIIFSGILFFLGFLAGIMYYRSTIAFRLITTDEHLEFISAGVTKVTVRYADMVKIERTKENILLVYAQPNPDKPVIKISDTITDREYLDSLLGHYVPITPAGKLPFRMTTMYTALAAFAFFAILMLHVMSRYSGVVFFTGAAILAYVTWSGIIYYRFRNQVSSSAGIFALMLLGVVAIGRIILYIIIASQGYS